MRVRRVLSVEYCGNIELESGGTEAPFAFNEAGTDGRQPSAALAAKTRPDGRDGRAAQRQDFQITYPSRYNNEPSQLLQIDQAKTSFTMGFLAAANLSVTTMPRTIANIPIAKGNTQQAAPSRRPSISRIIFSRCRTRSTRCRWRSADHFPAGGRILPALPVETPAARHWATSTPPAT